MRSPTTSPQVTGGGGFVFEDKVVAYYLACLLCNIPPLALELGTLSRISFQTGELGWFLDDVLLTLESDDGSHLVAVSVKSNSQFSRLSAPQDFVGSAWKQFLGQGTADFNPTNDYLTLVTSTVPAATKTDLDTLLDWAKKQQGVDMLSRLSASGLKPKAALFRSFQCPSQLALSTGMTEGDIPRLLSRMRHQQFDFHAGDSNSLQMALQVCRTALRSGDVREARSLWESLTSVASEYRPSAGSLDLAKLVTRLGTRYELREFPHYERDWQTLKTQTNFHMDSICDTIGGQVRIERAEEVALLTEGLHVHRDVVLLGSSGAGKSVVAKQCAQILSAKCPVLWWDATDFDDISLEREHHLGLRHPLAELFSSTTSAEGFLIIDRVDRIHGERALRNLSILLKAIHAEEDRRWRVLLICQPEDWDRVRTFLARTSAELYTWHTLTLNLMSISQLEPVWESYPALRSLSYQRDLHPVLLNPKVIDLLATKVASGGTIDTSDWVGESDLIEWFWSSEVAKGPHGVVRAAAMMELAERQGDTHSAAVPILALHERATYDELAADRLCRVWDNRIAFGHDLYGDWARQQCILQLPSVQEHIAAKSGLPVWQRAVRLYGLYLLEKHRLPQWRTLLQQLGTTPTASPLAQDLLLEAVIFAANPLPLLREIWQDLVADDGGLLKRFLGRFLAVATLPNSWYLNYAKTVGDHYEPIAATRERVPYWPFWLPLLPLLDENAVDAIRFAPDHVAQIANAWLRRGGNNWPYRAECARLALSIGRHYLHEENGNQFRRNKEAIQAAYQAALAGAIDLPEEVSAFALEACGRTPRPGDIRTIRAPIRDARVELPPPWPDGPAEPPNGNFSEACLTSQALYPLIEARPQIAREVVLALLIERRLPDGLEFAHPITLREMGTNHIDDWYPPFYTHPPLLHFLRTSPDEAVETVVRLVNFATERWADGLGGKYGSYREVSVTLEGKERIWIGNNDVYFWHLANGVCPEAVVVALICLEKWLYEQIEAGHSVDAHLATILNTSKSVALAGVMAAAGRKHPSLLKGVLRPLVGTLDFQLWEEVLGHTQFPRISAMLSYIGGSMARIEMAREWLSLPHRRVGLNTFALEFFHRDPEMRVFFQEVRQQWIERRSTTVGEDSRHVLEKYIACFDLENWHPVQVAGNGEVYQFTPPLHLLAARSEGMEQLNFTFLRMVLPKQCRQILDAELPMSDDELEPFWTKMQQAAAVEPPLERDSLNHREDAICGGIAVLLRLHRDWLAAHPDREAWCIDQLFLTLHEPPPPLPFDHEDDISDYNWHSFCAQAIPILWAENPDAPGLFQAAVQLLQDRHYNTVRLLFSALAREDRLGERFKQLQRFLLCWAQRRKFIKWHRFVMSQSTEAEWEEWLQAEWASWIQDEMQPFLEGQTPDEIDWTRVEVEGVWHTGNGYSRERDRPRHAPIVDLELIKAAFSWLPPLTPQLGQKERAEAINFWRRALHCLLNMLGGEDDGRKVEGTPHSWDRWVLENVAKLLGVLQPEERQEFFAPILGLGCSGELWVQSFLHSFFLYCMGEGAVTEEVMSAWEQMLSFAMTCPVWTRQTDAGATFVSELWGHLLGIDGFWSEWWTENKKAALLQVKPHYEWWATHSLDERRRASLFIQTLRQPGAESLLGDGLVWLEIGARSRGRDFWRDDWHRLAERLASLLALCWQSHREIITQYPATSMAFLSLLQQLADLQHPVALELQRRIAETKL